MAAFGNMKRRDSSRIVSGCGRNRLRLLRRDWIAAPVNHLLAIVERSAKRRAKALTCDRDRSLLTSEFQIPIQHHLHLRSLVQRHIRPFRQHRSEPRSRATQAADAQSRARVSRRRSSKAAD